MEKAPVPALRAALAVATVLLAGSCGRSDPVASTQPVEALTVVVAVVDSLMPHEISATSMPNLQALKGGGTVSGSSGGPVTVAGGTFYEQSRSVFVAETIPNHVAMMTGVYPDRSGIISNDYLDATADPPAEVDMGVPEFVTAKTLFTWIRERCRDSGVNPAIRTGAAMSKGYLFRVFEGDAANPDLANRDADVFNAPPDEHFNSPDDPAYLQDPAGLTPDTVTMARALERLPNVDFMFINLGDVDRLAHASGEQARSAALAEADTQLGNLVSALQAGDRWDRTVLIVTSDHGMDYTPPSSAAAINTQPTLDALGACFLPMTAAAANGATALVVVNDETAPLDQRQLALRAARTCLLGTDVDCAALCAGTTRPAQADQIAYAWYKADDAADAAGNMPASVRSRHANMADLALSPAPGNKFAEPDFSSSAAQIPGVHGGPNTLHNTMLVSGGSPWVRKNQVIASSVASPDALDRLPEQAEVIDIAPTVAWLLGLGITDGQFPDSELGRGFDGRVLSEAFVQFSGGAFAPEPAVCGLYAATP